MTYNMNSWWKYFLAMLLTAGLLESCIMTTVEEINTVTEQNGGAPNSKANEVPKGQFSIELINSANNTCLEIDSIKICNILVTDANTDTIAKGNKALSISTFIKYNHRANTSTETLPVQTFTPWTPDTHPQNSNKTYVKIYGRIYTHLADSIPLLLAEGPLYAPLTGKITLNSLSITEFELANNCPLYYETEGKMGKALNTINFEVTVNDWQEH